MIAARLRRNLRSINTVSFGSAFCSHFVDVCGSSAHESNANELSVQPDRKVAGQSGLGHPSLLLTERDQHALIIAIDYSSDRMLFAYSPNNLRKAHGCWLMPTLPNHPHCTTFIGEEAITNEA